MEYADNTIVVLWSDHGWQLGEHRMFSKHSNYEIATNSPLIIKLPGMDKPGTPSDGLVEAVDLFPTLTDLCGLPTPEGLAGESVSAMIDSGGAVGKEGAYSTHGGGRGFRGHTVRTDHYRLVRWINKHGDVGLPAQDGRSGAAASLRQARDRRCEDTASLLILPYVLFLLCN